VDRAAPADRLTVARPDELLGIAADVAQAAGALLRDRFGDPAAGVQAKTTPTDLVSDADHAAEDVIRGLLAERRPRDGVLAEETGDHPGDSDLRWVIDPLDGTVNFLFGIPHWAVSVACEDAVGTLAGVVCDPLRDETFAACREGAAMRNGKPIAGSDSTDLDTSLVATGFSYDAAVRARQAEVASRLLPAVRDLRRFGSAALDLAWTACGRYDAFYERGLERWDRVAGALICARAGLTLRELGAADAVPAGLLVAPAALVEDLEALVAG
jgi:myo-inositol-1(or 4)-monophosphatase